MIRKGTSAVPLAITIASKVLGFAREMVLLSAVGISYGLDIFVIFFGISSFLAALVGICVVTNLTPIMAQSSSPSKSLEVTAEGIKMGSVFTVIAWAICFAYAAVAIGEKSDAISYSLALIVPLIVLFSIIAEYQVSLFLSANRQMPVVMGNIIVSLPVVVVMLILDLSLMDYAIALVLSFALRSVIFFALLYKPEEGRFSWATALRRKPLVLHNARRVFAGASAMLAYSLVSVFAIGVAHRMGEGSAALIGYALKIPLLVLTSLWFVLGARFFSRIVQDNGAGAVPLMLRLTVLNVAVAIMLGVGAGLAHAGLSFYGADLTGVALDFARVIGASLPFLPIIVFVPIVEMSQRILATWGEHSRVPPVAAVILGVACVGFTAAVVLQSTLAIAWTLTGSLLAGAVVALRTVQSAAEVKING